jgi:hypothetical protein
VNDEPRAFDNLHDESDNLYEQNRELLATSEFGPQLLEVYDLAIARYPQLVTTEIVAFDDDSYTTTGIAISPWFSSTGRSQVKIAIKNTQEALAANKRVLDAIPDGHRLVAESWGIQPEELTPEMDFVGVFLHELGHTLEDADLTEYIEVERKTREGDEMPLGPVFTSSLVTPGTEEQLWLEENLEYFTEALGVDTVDELTHLHFKAYLELSWEKFANNFTAEIIATMSPSLRAHLTQRLL